MNNRGFTLVELLITIAIMGIITGISFAAIDALKTQNDDKKYKSFSNVLTNAAKLYVDMNKHDIDNCATITYEQLKGQNLVKNAKVNSKETCDKSYVVIDKNSDSNNYKYYPVVICGDKLKQPKTESDIHNCGD